MHHEWYNGEGYPIGKSGDDIPLYARIIKVTDSYDAMISKRPGREQLSPADAIEYMMAMAGAEFAPKLSIYFYAEWRYIRLDVKYCCRTGSMVLWRRISGTFR